MCRIKKGIENEKIIIYINSIYNYDDDRIASFCK